MKCINCGRDFYESNLKCARCGETINIGLCDMCKSEVNGTTCNKCLFDKNRYFVDPDNDQYEDL